MSLPTIWVALPPGTLALLEQRAARIGKSPALVAAGILTVHLREREREADLDVIEPEDNPAIELGED